MIWLISILIAINLIRLTTIFLRKSNSHSNWNKLGRRYKAVQLSVNFAHIVEVGNKGILELLRTIYSGRFKPLRA